VVIQPVSPSPVRSQYGCRTRDRGRSRRSTVATVHQTIRWAISTKALCTTMVVDICTTLVEYQGVEFDPSGADLSLASLFAGWALADELQRRLAADGLADIRFADGLLFQHLVGGPMTIGALADRLEVTQQAVSKSVADLERRGYVARSADPDDARARRVALTERGEAAIAGGRRHRAAIEAELAERLGPRRVDSARRLLVDVVDDLGAGAAVRARRVRPPR
jgi:DNA-binding MarR family transcriptional regulator